MTDPQYNHLALILDRSGSMSNIATDMNGGVESLLEEQSKLPGKLLVDVTLFDDKIEFPYEGVSADTIVYPLIKPRAATALLDAIGLTIVRLGERFAALPENERPGKVLVVIVTDGYENSSKEWTAEKIKELVKTQEDQFSWNFLFLGANIDSFTVGGSYGVKSNSTMNWTPTTAGVRSAMASVGNYTTQYFTGTAAEDLTLSEDSEEPTKVTQ